MPDELKSLAEKLPDRYQVERVLGEGATSIVFLAVDTREPRRHVAVKVLKPTIAESVSGQRFKREIDVAASLTHTNILPVFDSGAGPGLRYYTMPFLNGESLHDLLQRQPQLDIGHALRLSLEIASGLAYAHRQGFVHRDIKPANVLLADGHAVVADFGLARSLNAVRESGISQEGMAVGTALYMSPEQGAAQGSIDGRSDLYALGCVMFEMISGQPPFMGRNAGAILAQHAAAPPPDLAVLRPGVDPGLAGAIEKLLSKSPADRFQTAEQLEEVLEDCRVVHRTQERAHLEPQPPRWPWSVVWSALVVAVAAFVFAVGPRFWNVTPVQEQPDPTRIAVLYLEASDDDPVLENVGRGITRGLISALTDVPQLTVMSEPGIAAYSSSRPVVDDLIERFRVGTLIYGFIEQLADSVRLSVHMIDAVTNVEFDRLLIMKPRVSSIALLDQAVADVQLRLRARLGQEFELRDWRAGTDNDLAWEVHQLAVNRHRAAQAMDTGVQRAEQVRALEEVDSLLGVAIRSDSRWVAPLRERGWVAWTRASLLDPNARDERAAHEEWIRRGLEHADAASQLDDNAASTRQLRGYLNYRLWRAGEDRDSVLRNQSEEDLTVAVTADPNLARAWTALSFLWQRMGRRAEAQVAAQRAIEADAFVRDLPEAVDNLVYAHLYEGVQDSALAACEWGNRMFPTSRTLRWCELVVLGWYGRTQSEAERLDSLVAEYERLGRTEPPVWGQLVNGMFPVGRFFVAAAYARSGMRPEADSIRLNTRERLDDVGRGDSWRTNEAVVLAELGETEAALALIEEALADDPSLAPEMRRLPLLSPLHGVAAFRELVGLDPQP